MVSDISSCFLQFSPRYVSMNSVYIYYIYIYIYFLLTVYAYQFLKRLLLHVGRVLIWIFCTFCFLLPFQSLCSTNIWTFSFSKFAKSMFWLILTLFFPWFNQRKSSHSIPDFNLFIYYICFSCLYLIFYFLFFLCILVKICHQSSTHFFTSQFSISLLWVQYVSLWSSKAKPERKRSYSRKGELEYHC